MDIYEELEIKIKNLEDQLKNLENEHKKLQKWSDLNDYQLHEMINSLTKCVDKLMDIYEEDD